MWTASPPPIGHVGKAGVLEAPGLCHFGPAWRGDPRPCTDGGDVERLAIYCTLKTFKNTSERAGEGGLPTSARLYAGELEELYRHSLKWLFSEIEGLSDSTERALSAVGEGGSPGSASTRPPWRLCWLPRDARLLAGPRPRRSLGPTAKRGRPSGRGGGLAGGPTAAGRGSAGRLSAASADVADRRLGGGGGVR